MVSAIHGITPTYEHERVQRWQHTPSDRDDRDRPDLADTALRSFDVVWDDESRGRSFLWYGNGEAFQSLVSVWASYRGVAPNLRPHMRREDGVDLLAAFARICEPTTPGLSHFEELGMRRHNVGDTACEVVEHRFRVHWAQNTDGA